MRVSWIVLTVCVGLSHGAWADELSTRAWDLESKGDAAGARDLLQRAAQSNAATVGTLRDYAEFLDRHHDPAARDAYQKLLNVSTAGGRAPIARRLILLDLIAGDDPAARKHLEQYRIAGGKDVTLAPLPVSSIADKSHVITIPGPLRSFARMAALSPDMKADELLAALARNVVSNGYQATAHNESLEPTEYLKLVVRYLSQARELEKLAGAEKIIKIETCESEKTGELLRVLGYRVRGGCGNEVVLETVNATRAFLTVDSGFPLAELEQSLRTNRPFVYDFRPTEVPVLSGPDYWVSAAKESQSGEFIDNFIGDPSLCRLYLSLSKLDPATADEIRKNSSVQRIRAFAHVLDFYGGMFEIRNGRAIVPGGARSEKAWADLTGVSPEKGAAFFERLMAKDDGWLASYYDALARLTDDTSSGPVQTYLTEPEHLKRFYGAIRGKVTSPGPARPVFRANTDMVLLTARLRLDPDGRPHIPGDVEVWRNLFITHPHGKYDPKLTKAAASWKEPDDVLEALFGLSHKSVENEPLHIFMSLSDVDRRRKVSLKPATVNRLVTDFRYYGAQYTIFADAPELTDATVQRYMDVMVTLGQIKDTDVRADAVATFESLVSLWQIFHREGALPDAGADQAMAELLARFTTVKSERDVFDGGREGIKILLAATHSPANVPPQDRMVDLLAGTGMTENSDAHTQVVEDTIRILEAQRLVSLSTIFDLADNLDRVAKGDKLNTALVNKLASRISEIQLPRPTLTRVEKNGFSFGYWSERHLEAQRKLNLRQAIEKAASDPKRLDDVRGLLGPILRDTLVGFNYAHYAPPGAQILHANPLFVRSHDFIGLTGSEESWKTTHVVGNGWLNSGGGGKLVGSLMGLPYALAQAEQNFLIPSREQALIWADLVPQLIVTATIPRWWNVTPAQLHWVGLHMSYTETVAAEAALSPQLRQEFTQALGRYAMPSRTAQVQRLLESGQVREALDGMMPSEMFALAEDMDKKHPTDPIAAELLQESAQAPTELSYEAIARAFGTPKPTLANSYTPELLRMRTFPSLMGYSSRILAESWESNLLFYAALADQIYLQPSDLNVMVPAWTQETVQRIFATNLEDWPALLRSLRLVGDDVRQKTHKQILASAVSGN